VIILLLHILPIIQGRQDVQAGDTGIFILTRRVISTPVPSAGGRQEMQ
jgi:hypothetical protein